jgi:uncharacterized membrane protein
MHNALIQFVLGTLDAACSVGDATRDLRRLAVICVLFLPLLVMTFNLPMVVHHLPYMLVLTPLVALLTWLPQHRIVLGWSCVGVQAGNLAVIWFADAWAVWRFEYGLP